MFFKKSQDGSMQANIPEQTNSRMMEEGVINSISELISRLCCIIIMSVEERKEAEARRSYLSPHITTPPGRRLAASHLASYLLAEKKKLSDRYMYRRPKTRITATTRSARHSMLWYAISRFLLPLIEQQQKNFIP